MTAAPGTLFPLTVSLMVNVVAAVTEAGAIFSLKVAVIEALAATVPALAGTVSVTLGRDLSINVAGNGLPPSPKMGA